MNFKDINFKNIIKGICIFLIFWFSVYLQYIPVILFKLNVKSMGASSKCLLSLFSSSVIAIIFLIIYWKDLKKDFLDFKKNALKYFDEGIKYWFIGLLIMIFSNLLISILFKTSGANNENAVQELIKALPWAMFVSASFIGPFNEEMVFRKTLLDIFKDKWIITLTSFLLFGFAHVILNASVWTDYLYIIPYGALGGAFAYADCKTNNNIFTSVFLHMAHNAILITISIFSLMH